MSVTVVAPAHNEKYEVYMFCGMMLCQANKNWKAIIYHNGPNSWMRQAVESFKDERLIYKESEIDSGNWGTANRIDALQNLVDTEFIIQSSIQDYYPPIFIEEISKINDDLVTWNGINHIFGYSNALDIQPIQGRIDWGNFKVRTEIAKKVGINYPKEFCADGLFIHDLLKSNLLHGYRKINQILTYHN